MKQLDPTKTLQTNGAVNGAALIVVNGRFVLQKPLLAGDWTTTPATPYIMGTIVWFNNYFWMSRVNSPTDTPNAVAGNQWQQISNVADPVPMTKVVVIAHGAAVPDGTPPGTPILELA
jgi:hypothetical protein